MNFLPYRAMSESDMSWTVFGCKSFAVQKERICCKGNGGTSDEEGLSADM
jgi:hypothetical protein